MDNDLPPPNPVAVADALRTPSMTNLPTRLRLASGRGEAYWICVPIKRPSRPEGVVEYIERVGLATDVLTRYRALALWLALGCVLAITLAMNWLFRRTVYTPIERLLTAMHRVQEGDLSAAVEVYTQNELGRLAAGYNQMLAQIRA
ncbi:MAG: HAMP domain-containing protein [Acidobacteriota bacterium]